MTDAPAAKPGLPPALQSQLRSMSGDMTFLGIFIIIIGALYCLTILGAAFGIPMIFAGIRLKNSAEAFAAYTIGAESASLRSALEHLGKHFRIVKILTLVSIGLMILYFVIMILIVGLAFSGANTLE